MLKRRYESQGNRKNGRIDRIRTEIENLKGEEKLLRERMKDLAGDPAKPYLTERLSFVERRIKKLQVEEKLSNVTIRFPFYLKERTVSDEDTLGSGFRLSRETREYLLWLKENEPKEFERIKEEKRRYAEEIGLIDPEEGPVKILTRKVLKLENFLS